MNADNSSVKSGSRKSKSSKDGSMKKSSIKSQQAGSVKRTSLKELDQAEAKRVDMELNKGRNEDGVKLRVYEQIMFERRVLLLCTVLIGLAMVTWIVAIATDHWYIVDGGKGIYIAETRRYFLYSNSGIFTICRYAFSNHSRSYHQPSLFPNLNMSQIMDVANVSLTDSPDNSSVPVTLQPPLTKLTKTKITSHKFCWNHVMFIQGKLDSSVDQTIIDFNRVEGFFAVMTLVLMLLGLLFSMYTFKNTRYMFKRTAGGIHFLSTAASLTVIQVLMHSVEYERVNLPFTFPPGATQYYGYSYKLAWLVFAANLICGFLFMLYSRKRKGKKAPTEEMGMADEPTIIGR